MFSGAHLNVNGWESRVKLKSIFSISPFSTSRRRTAAVLGIRIGSALQIHFLHIFFGFVDFVGFCVSAIRKAMHIGTELILCYYWISFWFSWPISRLLSSEKHRIAPAALQRLTYFHLVSVFCPEIFHLSVFIPFLQLDQLLWTIFSLVSTGFLSNGCSFLELSRDCLWLRISTAKGATRKKTPFVQGFRLATVLL